MIYLNPAGLSRFHPEVQQEMSRTLCEFEHLLFSDAGVQYYRDTLQRCRRILADWLAVDDAQRIAFTPNATTACCLALSRIHWKAGDTLVTTTHENSTILQEIHELEDRGVNILALDPNSPSGLLPELAATFQQKLIRALVVSHVSHLDGRIFPIAEIQEQAQAHHALLIVDGAQAVGHIPVSFRQIHTYAYFFPGHKWCAGPMGTGALILDGDYDRNEIKSDDDKQDQDRRPLWSRYELGTHNIGLIAGLAKACALNALQTPGIQKLHQIRDEWKIRLRGLPGVRVLEWDGPHAPGIISFVCLNQQTEQFIQATASTHSLAWKTFAHPLYPSHASIRISWSTNTPERELRSAMAYLHPI